MEKGHLRLSVCSKVRTHVLSRTTSPLIADLSLPCIEGRGEDRWDGDGGFSITLSRCNLTASRRVRPTLDFNHRRRFISLLRAVWKMTILLAPQHGYLPRFDLHPSRTNAIPSARSWTWGRSAWIASAAGSPKEPI